MIGMEKEKFLRFRESLQSLIPRYVPEGRSLNDLLEELADKWNPLFDTTQRKNLVEDVNALVRDFLRPIRRSLLLKPPDAERVHALAEQLSGSKSLAKIAKKDHLLRYLELYVVKCLDTTTV